MCAVRSAASASADRRDPKKKRVSCFGSFSHHAALSLVPALFVWSWTIILVQFCVVVWDRKPPTEREGFVVFVFVGSIMILDSSSAMSSSSFPDTTTTPTGPVRPRPGRRWWNGRLGRTHPDNNHNNHNNQNTWRQEPPPHIRHNNNNNTHSNRSSLSSSSKASSSVMEWMQTLRPRTTAAAQEPPVQPTTRRTRPNNNATRRGACDRRRQFWCVSSRRQQSVVQQQQRHAQQQQEQQQQRYWKAHLDYTQEDDTGNASLTISKLFVSPALMDYLLQDYAPLQGCKNEEKEDPATTKPQSSRLTTIRFVDCTLALASRQEQQSWWNEWWKRHGRTITTVEWYDGEVPLTSDTLIRFLTSLARHGSALERLVLDSVSFSSSSGTANATPVPRGGPGKSLEDDQKKESGTTTIQKSLLNPRGNNHHNDDHGHRVSVGTALAQLVSQCPHLTHLEWRHCQWWDEWQVLQDFGQGLIREQEQQEQEAHDPRAATTPALQHMRVEACPLDTLQTTLLLQALLECPQLQSLHLSSSSSLSSAISSTSTSSSFQNNNPHSGLLVPALTLFLQQQAQAKQEKDDGTVPAFQLHVENLPHLFHQCSVSQARALIQAWMAAALPTNSRISSSSTKENIMVDPVVCLSLRNTGLTNALVMEAVIPALHQSETEWWLLRRRHQCRYKHPQQHHYRVDVRDNPHVTVDPSRVWRKRRQPLRTHDEPQGPCWPLQLQTWYYGTDSTWWSSSSLSGSHRAAAGDGDQHGSS